MKDVTPYLLPAKASCRALANLISENGEGVLIDEAAKNISGEAWELAAYLIELDEKHQTPRDDVLATAFPYRDRDPMGACRRYANQFVGSISTRGNLSGLLFRLKLINQVKRGEPRILLTEVGWRFALLRNPILDDPTGTPEGRLSPDEVKLLLQHIQRNVPVECFAYVAVLNAIAQGHNTPNALDEVLKQYVADSLESKPSESFLRSQRSGAISRMADLGLLGRSRKGLCVSYSLTEAGQVFLNWKES